MKKTLVAIAALAAFGAQAQSSVTITGNVDAGYQSVKTDYGNATSASVRSVSNGTQNTNNVTFRLKEDLGGGLKASALYELDFDATGGYNFTSQNTGTTNTASAPTTAEVFVAVAGGFGEIKAGNANLPTFGAQAARSAFGTKIGSGYGDNAQLGTKVLRAQGATQYLTPAIAGFQGAVAYKPKTVAAAQSATAAEVVAAGDITDYSLTYVNGPLKAVVSNYKQTNTLKQTQFAVNYVLGKATLIAGMHNEKSDGTATAADKSGNNIGLKYALTANVTLLAQHTTLNDKLTANKDKKIDGIGAQYALSKRTNAYVRYVTETNDNNGTGATDKSKVTTTLVGLAHAF